MGKPVCLPFRIPEADPSVLHQPFEEALGLMSQLSREQHIMEKFAAASSLLSSRTSALPTARVLLALSADDEAVVSALAEIAVINLQQEQELCARTLEVQQLQYALDSRVRLEQAKGVLFASGADSLDCAFNTMRAYARSHNLRLHDVAASVVRGDIRPTASGLLAEAGLVVSRA